MPTTLTYLTFLAVAPFWLTTFAWAMWPMFARQAPQQWEQWMAYGALALFAVPAVLGHWVQLAVLIELVRAGTPAAKRAAREAANTRRAKHMAQVTEIRELMGQRIACSDSVRVWETLLGLAAAEAGGSYPQDPEVAKFAAKVSLAISKTDHFRPIDVVTWTPYFEDAESAYNVALALEVLDEGDILRTKVQRSFQRMRDLAIYWAEVPKTPATRPA